MVIDKLVDLFNRLFPPDYPRAITPPPPPEGTPSPSPWDLRRAYESDPRLMLASRLDGLEGRLARVEAHVQRLRYPPQKRPPYR